MIKTKYTKLYLLAFFTTVFAWYSYASSPCWTLSNCLTEIRSNDSWYIGYIIWETFDNNSKIKSEYLYWSTTSQTWVVRLENSTWSTSQYTVPTSAILKSVWDNLNTRLNAVSTDLYGSYVNLTSEQNISWEKNFLNNMWIGWVKSSNTRLVVKWTWTGSTSYWLNVIDSLNNSLFLVRDDWKVGIWTTAPYGPLEVRWLSPADTGWHAWILNVVNSAPMQSWIGWTIHLYGNYMNTTPSTAVFAEIAGIKENWTSGDSKWVLTFSTRAWASLPDEKMRITSNGNVGIWTTIPSDILTLKSNNPRIRMDDSDTLNNWRITLDNNAIRIESDVDNLTSDSLIAFLVDNSIKMVIKDSWNVGIGTSNPLYTLDVLKSAWNASIRAKSDGIDSVSSIYIQNDSKSYAIQTDWWNNDKLIFYDNTAWSSRMVIDSFWNIWIWTISPTSLFTISKNQNTWTTVDISNNNTTNNAFVGYNIRNSSHWGALLFSGVWYSKQNNDWFSTDWASDQLALTTSGVWGLTLWAVNNWWSIKFIVSDYSEVMRIDRYWNVWIWTISPTNKLTIVDWVDITWVDTWWSMLIKNSGYNLRIDSNEMQLSNNWTAASFSINSYWWNVYLASTLYVRNADSSVWIWTNNPSYKLQVAWTVAWTSWTATSDVRYKKNIRTITQALDKVEKMRWVNYEWKIGDYKDMWFRTWENMWFIAQELEKIIPEVVDTDNKWYKSVEYANITAILVEAVKELKKEKDTEIDSLKKEIEVLKKQQQLDF